MSENIFMSIFFFFLGYWNPFPAHWMSFYCTTTNILIQVQFLPRRRDAFLCLASPDFTMYMKFTIRVETKVLSEKMKGDN
jgi:hypothetical protein